MPLCLAHTQKNLFWLVVLSGVMPLKKTELASIPRKLSSVNNSSIRSRAFSLLPHPCWNFGCWSLCSSCADERSCDDKLMRATADSRPEDDMSQRPSSSPLRFFPSPPLQDCLSSKGKDLLETYPLGLSLSSSLSLCVFKKPKLQLCLKRWGG